MPVVTVVTFACDWLPASATLQREVGKVPFNQGNHWIATLGNQTIVAVANRRGWNINEIAKFRPRVLSTQLTGSACGPQGRFARNGRDTCIEKQAHRKRIPIGSLETMDGAIETLEMSYVSGHKLPFRTFHVPVRAADRHYNRSAFHTIPPAFRLVGALQAT
jgi:hypothetical protein